MSTAMQTVCASAPVDDLDWWLIELKCDAWEAPTRLVQSDNPDGENFTLETGEIAHFKASGMAVSLPDVTAKGSQDLTIQLYNVSGEALELVDQALDAGEQITAVLRAYVESDRNAPAKGPVEMTVNSVEIDTWSVVCSASFASFIDTPWPFKRFTPSNAPGLIYQ